MRNMNMTNLAQTAQRNNQERRSVYVKFLCLLSIFLMTADKPPPFAQSPQRANTGLV
jgi:hypothetical protein